MANAAADVAAAAAPTLPAAASVQRPSFDVVRVEPSGAAVIAGHGVPKGKVVLLDGSRGIETTDADAAGQFVFLPPAFAAGRHELHLALGAPIQAGAARESVAITVPPGGRGEVAVSRIPADAAPPSPAVVSATRASAVTIRSIEVDPAGALVVRGEGEKDHALRLRLNGDFVATVKPQADRSWSVRVEKGVAPGRYQVQADDVRDGGAEVLASAEAVFEYAGKLPPSASRGRGFPAVPAAAPDMSANGWLAPTVAGGAAARKPTAQVAGAASGAAHAQSPASRLGVGARERNAAPNAPGRLPLPARIGTAAGRQPAIALSAPALMHRPGGTAVARPAITPPFARRFVPAIFGRLARGARPRVGIATSIRYGRRYPVPGTRLFRTGPQRAHVVPAMRVLPPRPGPARPAPATAAHAVVPQIRSVVVKPGDNLWNISQIAYGSGPNFGRIVQANGARIRDPQRIFTGQVLILPPQGGLGEPAH